MNRLTMNNNDYLESGLLELLKNEFNGVKSNKFVTLVNPMDCVKWKSKE